MPTVVYKIKTTKNDGLPISVDELVDRYLFGIDLIDRTGRVMSNESIEFYIRDGKEQIEGILDVKVCKQVFETSASYFRGDYQSWGRISTAYPIIRPLRLTGFLGKIEQIVFPESWLSSKSVSDGINYNRGLNIVPSAGGESVTATLYAGFIPHLGWWDQPTIPNYWSLVFCTSFDRIPEDILDVLGKFAAINIFHQLGDIIIGAGIASQTLSLDNLSQTIDTTSSATNSGYGGRINGYLKELPDKIEVLKGKYNGIRMLSM